MKKSETYRRCEYCDKMMLDVSPPPKEQYESARVDIIDGTLLLPSRAVDARQQRQNRKRRLKDDVPVTASHAVDLEGRYCSPRCFVNKIRVELGAEPE